MHVNSLQKGWCIYHPGSQLFCSIIFASVEVTTNDSTTFIIGKNNLTSSTPFFSQFSYSDYQDRFSSTIPNNKPFPFDYSKVYFMSSQTIIQMGVIHANRVGLAISRSIFISREREFPKHFGYFPGISRELKTYLIANRKYPIFERKCIFWGSRIILSFVTIIFDSKVWFWAQRKISKIEWNRKICQSQYIKISRNFPGNRKNSRDQAGLKIFGKFPGFPGREFPGTSPKKWQQVSFLSRPPEDKMPFYTPISNNLRASTPLPCISPSRLQTIKTRFLFSCLQGVLQSKDE